MKKKSKKIFSGLSLKYDSGFVRNLVIVFGVVLVRRGLRNLIDLYLIPEYYELSNWISIGIGIGLLFLLDGTIDELGA